MFLCEGTSSSAESKCSCSLARSLSLSDTLSLSDSKGSGYPIWCTVFKILCKVCQIWTKQSPLHLSVCSEAFDLITLYLSAYNICSNSHYGSYYLSLLIRLSHLGLKVELWFGEVYFHLMNNIKTHNTRDVISEIWEIEMLVYTTPVYFHSCFNWSIWLSFCIYLCLY